MEKEGPREGTEGWRGGPRLRAGGGEEEALRGGGPRLAPKAVLESQAERAAAAGPKRPPRFAGDAVAEVAAEGAALKRPSFLGGEAGAEEAAEECPLGAPLALARLTPSAGAATRVLLSQRARGTPRAWSVAGAAPPPESPPARGEAGLTPSAGAAGAEGGTSVLLSQGATQAPRAWRAAGAAPPPAPPPPAACAEAALEVARGRAAATAACLSASAWRRVCLPLA